jgi:hypothetical protein
MYCEWERSRKRVCEIYSLRKNKLSVPTQPSIHSPKAVQCGCPYPALHTFSKGCPMWLSLSSLISVFIWCCWTCSGFCIKDFLWVLNIKRSINIDHTFCQCHGHTSWKRISLFARLCVRFGILLKITLLWSHHFAKREYSYN